MSRYRVGGDLTFPEAGSLHGRVDYDFIVYDHAMSGNLDSHVHRGAVSQILRLRGGASTSSISGVASGRPGFLRRLEPSRVHPRAMLSQLGRGAASGGRPASTSVHEIAAGLPSLPSCL